MYGVVYSYFCIFKMKRKSIHDQYTSAKAKKTKNIHSVLGKRQTVHNTVFSPSPNKTKNTHSVLGKRQTVHNTVFSPVFSPLPKKARDQEGESRQGLLIHAYETIEKQKYIILELENQISILQYANTMLRNSNTKNEKSAYNQFITCY
jgi:hypothetical protein